MVEIRIFGSADSEACNKMTAAVCEVFSEVLGIRGDRVYVSYSFHNEWGWNGENF